MIKGQANILKESIWALSQAENKSTNKELRWLMDLFKVYSQIKHEKMTLALCII